MIGDTNGRKFQRFAQFELHQEKKDSARKRVGFIHSIQSRRCNVLRLKCEWMRDWCHGSCGWCRRCVNSVGGVYRRLRNA